MLRKRRSHRSRAYRRFVLIACLGAAMLPQSAKSADLFVTSASDSGPGSLRDALQNAQPGDRVVFDFAADTTITLSSSLPSISNNLSFRTSNPIRVDIDRNSAAAALDLAGGTIDPTNLNVVDPLDATDISVGSATTLIGDGAVAGDINTLGTLSPGRTTAIGDIGRIDINGDLDVAGGLFQADLSTVGGTPLADNVVASQAINVANSQLAFRFNGDRFEAGQQFAILQSGTGLTGTFANQASSFAIPNRPFLELVQDTDPILSTTQLRYNVQDNGVAFSTVVTGRNRLSAVATFEELRGTGQTGVNALVNSSGESMVSAANALSGSIYPSLIGAEITHIQNNVESVRDRVLLQRYACVEAPAIMPWIRGYGVAANVDEDQSGTLGYYQEFGGMELGLAISNKNGLSSHVFAHLGGGDLETSGADQRAEIESYRGGGSVEYVGNRIYVLAAGGAGTQSYDVYRSLAVIEGATSTQSSFDGSAQFGYAEAGTVFVCHAIEWIPYVGLHATHVELDPITETGDADFRLTNAGGDGDSIRGVLGLGMQQTAGTPIGQATTRVRFGWLHEYRDPNEVFVSNVANANVNGALTDLGVNAGRDWGFLRAQVDWFRLLGGQTSISYQGQANSQSSFNALAGGIQWVW